MQLRVLLEHEPSSLSFSVKVAAGVLAFMSNLSNCNEYRRILWHRQVRNDIIC